MAKKIINRTDAEVYIQIQGTEYSVKPNSFVVLDRDSDAEAWKKIHGFLEIETVASTPVESEDFEINESVVIEVPVTKEEVVAEEVVVPEVETKKKKSK